MKRLEERKIHVQLTDAAKEQLVREGYDPAYGARPLKRTIQRRVLDPLAMRVLEGEFREGDTVDGGRRGDEGLRFEKTPGGQAHDAAPAPSSAASNPRGDRRGARPDARRARRRRSGTASRSCCCSASRRCTS